MSDFLDEKKAGIQSPIDELQPHVDEHAKLLSALEAGPRRRST